MRDKFVNRASEQLAQTVRSYLHAIKRDDIKVEFDRDEGYPEDYLAQRDGAVKIDGWCCIAPGHKHTPIIGQTIITDHWYVYAWRTISNYPHAPDDTDMELLFDHGAFHECAKNAIWFVLRNEMDAADQIDWVEEPTREEVEEAQRAMQSYTINRMLVHGPGIGKTEVK